MGVVLRSRPKVGERQEKESVECMIYVRGLAGLSEAMEFDVIIISCETLRNGSPQTREKLHCYHDCRNEKFTREREREKIILS